MKCSVVLEGDLTEVLEVLAQLHSLRRDADPADPVADPGAPSLDAPVEEWAKYAERRGDPNAHRRSKADLVARHGGA